MKCVTPNVTLIFFLNRHFLEGVENAPTPAVPSEHGPGQFTIRFVIQVKAIAPGEPQSI